MKPIVDQALAQAGAVQAYDNVMGQYKTVPLLLMSRPTCLATSSSRG